MRERFDHTHGTGALRRAKKRRRSLGVQSKMDERGALSIKGLEARKEKLTEKNKKAKEKAEKARGGAPQPSRDT